MVPGMLLRIYKHLGTYVSKLRRDQLIEVPPFLARPFYELQKLCLFRVLNATTDQSDRPAHSKDVCATNQLIRSHGKHVDVEIERRREQVTK